MTTATTKQRKAKSVVAAKPVKAAEPTQLQVAFIAAGLSQKWATANITGKAPAQDALPEWEALIAKLSDVIDVPAYAKAACSAYYGGDEIDNEVVEEEEAPVKPAAKSKKKPVGKKVVNDDDASAVASTLGISPDIITMLLLGQLQGANGALDFSSVLPIDQIVAGYSPAKPRSIYAQMLRSIGQQLGVELLIAIDADGRVNRAATVANIEDLEQGFPKVTVYSHKGVMYQLIAVGVDPMAFADADPLSPQDALRRGVGVGNIDYSGCPEDVKYVIYYAANFTQELGVSDRKWLRKMLQEGDVQIGDLAEDCPLAVVMYNENRRNATLPPLRAALGNKPQPKPEKAVPVNDQPSKGITFNARW